MKRIDIVVNGDTPTGKKVLNLCPKCSGNVSRFFNTCRHCGTVFDNQNPNMIDRTK